MIRNDLTREEGACEGYDADIWTDISRVSQISLLSKLFYFFDREHSVVLLSSDLSEADAGQDPTNYHSENG